MDAELKLLADASLAVGRAEDALDENAAGAAADALDDAAATLQALRERWPALAAPQRTMLGRTAAPVRARLDSAKARLPKRSALSTGAPEHDPEQDADPAAA